MRTYRFPLDHAGDSGASQIKQRLDIHVVCREDQLEQQDLLQIDKVGIPLLDDVRHDLALQGFLDFRHRFRQVMLTELNNLLEDLRLDVGQGELRNSVLAILCGKQKKNRVEVLDLVRFRQNRVCYGNEAHPTALPPRQNNNKRTIHHTLHKLRHLGDGQGDREGVSLFADLKLTKKNPNV